MSYKPGPGAPGYVATGGTPRATYAVTWSVPAGTAHPNVNERAWALLQITGHDAANPVPQVVSGETASGTASPTLTLAAPVSAASRPFSFWHAYATEGGMMTPRSGWTELVETAAYPIYQAVQWHPTTFDTTATATAASSATPFRGIAIEVAASGTIAQSLLNSGGSATTTSVAQVTGSVSPAANSLLLLAVSHGQGILSPPIITGLGLSWVQVRTVGTTTNRLTLYRAQCGAAPGTGTITINWNTSWVGDGGALTGYVWAEGNWRTALIEATLGTGFNPVNSQWVFSLPTGTDAPLSIGKAAAGQWSARRGTDIYQGPIILDAAAGLMIPRSVYASNGLTAALTNTAPITWAAADALSFLIRYPTA